VPSRDKGNPEPTPGKHQPRPGTVRLVPPGIEPAPAAEAVPGPPALSSGPDAWALLKAIRRRWMLVVCLGAALAGTAAGALWFFLPAECTAFSLLQVSSAQATPGSSGLERVDFTTYMKTQADRIKSRDVLIKTLSQEPVRNLALVRQFPDTLSTLAWLEENTNVNYRTGSEVLTISVNGYDPNELTVLVNNLTDSYLSILKAQESQMRSDRVKKMKEHYQATKQKLSEKVALRESNLKGQGATDPASMLQKQAVLQGQLTRVEDQLDLIEFKLAEKEAHIAGVNEARKRLKTNPPKVEVTLKDLENIDQTLRDDADEMRKLDKLGDRLVEAGHPRNDPTLLQVRRKAAELKKKVDARSAELRKTNVTQMLAKADADLANTLIVLKDEITPLENQKTKLQARLDKLRVDVGTAKYTTARDEILQKEIEQDEKALGEIHTQLKSLQVDAEADCRVQKLWEAEWQPKNERKRKVLLILVPLVIFLGTGAVIAWWDCAARRIHSPEEVTAGLSLPIVGSVPALPNIRHLLHVPQEDPNSHSLQESINGIRTTLLRHAKDGQTQVIMVVSAVSGEGKTTLASNLALSLARAGRKTVLVDCDLRCPSVHQVFEQVLQPGLSEVLLGEVELPDAVRPSAAEELLSLLTAGQWDREVLQELARKGPENIFEKLRMEFDFIIVDSHPVLPATDALLLGQYADAVIVSLMRDISQMHLVHEAWRRLATLGIHVFGGVVNGVPAQTYGSRYQYAAPQAAA
jgi:capsular exopolysaccharide synthesis family protein